MKIVRDPNKTVVELQFCCMRMSRKMLPIFHDKGLPIVVTPYGIRARGLTLHFCPYCGEKIREENIDEDFYLRDPLNQGDEHSFSDLDF